MPNLDAFDRVRNALWLGRHENQVVVVGGKWFSNWNAVGSDGIIPHIPNDAITGLHCYTLIDWTTINGTEYIIGQNSYGTQFGKGGLQLFSRKTFNDAWSTVWKDATCMYIFRDIDDKDVENLKAQKLSLLEIILSIIQRKLATLGIYLHV